VNGTILGLVGAAFGVAATIITVWSARRLTASQTRKVDQDAFQVQEKRLDDLHKQLDEEIARRREAEHMLGEAERTISRHEWRIGRLEDQVRSMGGVPVNGPLTT